MSHFTVLVIGDNAENQLIPFEEQTKNPKFTEFKDCTQEVIDGYTDERKKEYKTIEVFAREYFGYSVSDGKYGYIRNPNAKWDWYVLGGRWVNTLKLKMDNFGYGIIEETTGLSYGELSNLQHIYKTKINTFTRIVKKYRGKVDAIMTVVTGDDISTKLPVMLAKHTKGTGGVFDDFKEVEKFGYADSARKADIDFDGMRQDSIDETRKRFRDYREKMANGEGESVKFELAYGYNLSLEDFAKLTEDAFVAKQKHEFGTFALLMNGKWYEKGKMGWWACVSEEKDNWDEEFKLMIDALPNDALLSVYDCHI